MINQKLDGILCTLRDAVTNTTDAARVFDALAQLSDEIGARRQDAGARVLAGKWYDIAAMSRIIAMNARQEG
jgi:hypothetical protein